jgi:hypothetical protein
VIPGTSILIVLTSVFVLLTYLHYVLSINQTAALPLPTGNWALTEGTLQDIAVKSTLKLSSVDQRTGLIQGSFDGDSITGTWDQHTNTLNWNIIKYPDVKYTGYLLLEPGCSLQPGGVCTYTLTGYGVIPFHIIGEVVYRGHTLGWYAQIKVPFRE